MSDLNRDTDAGSGVASSGVASSGDAGAGDTGSTVAALRRKLAAMGSPGISGDGAAVLAVPEPVAGLLPRGGLVRGTVTAVSGASTLPVALLAAATAAGATAALVGLPQLNLAMAADLGADLSRIAVVPLDQPGADPLEVAAVLLDGIDVVLVAVDTVMPSRARVLSGRARRQSSALVAVGAPGAWPGAALRLEAQVAGYRHLPLRRNGYGRIGGLQVDIRAAGNGVAPRTTRCELVAPGYGEPGNLRLVTMESRGSRERQEGRESPGNRMPRENRLRVAN